MEILISGREEPALLVHYQMNMEVLIDGILIQEVSLLEIFLNRHLQMDKLMSLEIQPII